MVAQRALGFAGRAAGVVEDGDGVGVGEVAHGDGAGGFRRREQVAAIIGVFEREHRPQSRRARGKLGAARPEHARVDDECVSFGILDLIELVGERAEWMQRGGGGAGKLRRDARAPGLVPVGGEERNAAAAAEPRRHEHRLHATDQVVYGAVGEGAAVPGESGARRITAERRERLRTGGRAGIERRPHGISLLVMSKLVLPLQRSRGGVRFHLRAKC